MRGWNSFLCDIAMKRYPLYILILFCLGICLLQNTHARNL